MKHKTTLKEIILIFCTVAVITAVGAYLYYADRKREGTFGEDYAYLDPGLGAMRSTPTPTPEPTQEPIAPDMQVELNTATKEELMTLPGIGEGLAARIIAQREEAPFKQVRDLKKVAGIGNKTLKKLIPYVYVAKSEATKAP